VTLGVELFTVEKAKELMENPRPATRTHHPSWMVNGFAERMKTGAWEEASVPYHHTESIKIDEQGRLVDGMLRLKALVQADVELHFHVMRGNFTKMGMTPVP
jgi:hypothetical protein